MFSFMSRLSSLSIPLSLLISSLPPSISPSLPPSISRHPIAVLFHVIFRTSALILYVFASYVFSNSFVELFIAIILLLALDFWVVKNVTGRLLVGLRWWNKVEEDGTSTWMFESKQVWVWGLCCICNINLQVGQNRIESAIFWGTLLGFPVLWVVFFFTALIKFAWMWMVSTPYIRLIISFA